MKKINVVIYAEYGQYAKHSFEMVVKTTGTELALKRLAKKYAYELGCDWDNWGGFHPAQIGIFKGSMVEFLEKYPERSERHYITGGSYRVGCFDSIQSQYQQIENNGYVNL